MVEARVEIHYRRPPDRVQVFTQAVVDATPERTVTFLPRAGISRPSMAGGRVILEPDSPVVWFTYPGEWHDIGRFHLADGTFTGCYANLLTPVAMEGARWETTDLFVDVWVPAEGEPELLDVEELAEAVRAGWVDEAVAVRVRRHADELMGAARSGAWPPAEVQEWTLARVRERLGQSFGSITAAETRRFRST